MATSCEAVLGALRSESRNKTGAGMSPSSLFERYSLICLLVSVLAVKTLRTRYGMAANAQRRHDAGEGGTIVLFLLNKTGAAREN